MTFPQILLLLILGSSVLLYTTRWIPSEATSAAAIAALALTGLLTPNEALTGFASSALITIAAMFVLSAGLVQTGALEALTIWMARFSRGNPTRLLLLLGLVIPVSSAFINNTPVVAMMIPVIISLSGDFGVRPSKLLIPVSYLAILGGTLTLLGTSTNILMDDLYRASGGPGFGLFDFSLLGVIYTLVGVVVILALNQRVLPNRAPLADLASGRKGATYISEITVGGESSLVGQQADSVFQRIAKVEPMRPPSSLVRHRRLGQPTRLQPPSGNHAASDGSVELLEIFRNGRIYRAEETRSLTLQLDDTLMVAGTPKEITRFLGSTHSRLATVLEDDERTAAQSIDQKVVEAVVLPDSPLDGRIGRELELNRRYSIKLLGVQRNGRQQLSGLRAMRLQQGDVLLLQARPEQLQAASEKEQLLLVEGVGRSILRVGKTQLALAIMAAVVLLATLTPLPIVMLALSGAALMVITQCLRVDEALRSLDSKTILLIAAAIPLGTALESTGLAQSAVDLLLRYAGDAHPVVFLSAFYLLTNLLAQIIINKAVVVLFVPIALTLAATLDLNAMPLLMAILFGANASFMTPMGHQCNIIVMGPGGYSFSDYLRIGAPLSLLLWIVATIAIPLIWPLT